MAPQPERPDRAPEPDTSAARAEALSIEGTHPRGTALVDPKALVVDGRRLIKIFVSYAHEDKTLKEELLKRLDDRLKAASDYRFELWDDREIHPGELWHEGIQAAIAACDYGLLLLSYKFLRQDYILESELPFFVSAGSEKLVRKRSIPVALKAISLDRKVNLRGLEKHQIFLGDGRAFAQGRKRDEFADELFDKILSLAAKHFPLTSSETAELLEPLEVREPSVVRAPETSGFEAFDRPPIPWTGSPIDPEKTLPNRAMETSLRKGESESPATFGKPVEALAFLRDWVTDPAQPPFCALLGEYGMGKTTTSEMFTRRLIEDRKSDPSLPIPIYFDLRWLGDDAKQNPLLEDTLRIVAMRTYGDAPSSGEIKVLVQSGRAVAIFDGLDEVLVHLTEAQGKRFTRQLWGILPLRRTPLKEGEPAEPRGKLIISCRTHYFRTLREEKNHFLGEDREVISAADYRALVLLPFTTEQIEEYLAKNFPGQDIEKLLDLIRSVHNLEELAERPYTLKLIAEHIPKLEQWKLKGLKVTGVTLYREMVTSWLERDAGKHTLTPDHKLRLMEHFATELWASGKRFWSAEEVEQWLMDFLEKYPGVRSHYEGEKRALLKEDLRTATFLVRAGDDGFRFAHTSLQEFFLAVHLHRALREKRFEAWQIPRPSPETLDFLGQLIAEEEREALAAFRELRGTYRPQASELMLAYALRAKEKGHPAPSLAGIQLDGAQLKGWTIAAPTGSPLLDLQRVSLRGANLDGTKLHRIDVSDADFRRANLLGTEAIGGNGKGANFGESVLVGTVFRDLDLSGAAFKDAKLYRTQWLRCGLGGISGLDRRTGGLFAECEPLDWNFQVEKERAELAVLQGHAGWVRSCAFSPDGATLASVGDDGSIRFWDARTGDLLRSLRGHNEGVRSCTFSFNGAILASAGNDGTVRLWDVSAGDLLRSLRGHVGEVWCCAFSPDGATLASTGKDGTVRLWNARTGDPLRSLQGHPKGAGSCAFSPDGAALASAGNDGTVRLWDARTGGPLRALKGHSRGVNSCAFSPDGAALASAGSDGIRLWDARTGESLRSFIGHAGWVWSCAFSPDGGNLASAGEDGKVRLWDARTGAHFRSLNGHKGWAWSCTFSPDGATLASTGNNGTVRLWDARTGEPLRSLKGHAGFVLSCAFSPDGAVLASAGVDGNVRLWDARTGVPLRSLKGSAERIFSCTFSPDGATLASAGSDGTIQIWDACTGESLRLIKGHARAVLSCAFSPDGGNLASAGEDGNVRLWDARTGKHLRTLKGHKGWAWSCSFSPDGATLASTGKNGTVRLWDAQSGESLRLIKGHGREVLSCAFSPDGGNLASAGQEGQVRLWDARTGQLLRSLKGHSGGVLSCTFSPDGASLSSTGFDGSVRLWDAATGEEIRRIQLLPNGELALFFGPDLALSYASPGAWRWLGWLAPDPETGVITRYPAEIFGPLPGPDANGGFRGKPLPALSGS